ILLHDNGRPHIAEPGLQKLYELGYETLPHPPNSTDSRLPTTIPSRHVRTFCARKVTNHDDAKNLFNEFIATRALEFYATEINKFVCHWQKC
ncbi:hypothetical protein Angca_003068, partial [Angiostrongylus cantonensis]